MIEVRALYHSYTKDEVYAVNGISFDIERGEIFGFLGPNGAGKSTTQKILTGLIPLQRGTVSVAGEDIRKIDSNFYNRIGVSFEQPNLYYKLTGLENLEYFGKMYDVPTENPMDLLKLVGLDESASRRTGEYSKGMRQKLVFARSLLNKPEIWFLDEPISGLDPASATNIKKIIKQKKDEGTTIFLTTHNMHIADELCDRVAFIVNGRIVLIDSPRNLKLQYGEKLIEVEYRFNGELKKDSFSMLESDDKAKLYSLIEKNSIETVHSKEATLEEIFIRSTGEVLK